MSKKANDKSIVDESVEKADDTTTDHLSSEGDTSASDQLSADEMDVFNQIMGEIEGEVPADEPPLAAAVEDPAGPIDSQSDTQAEDDLDDDQQKTFESIMAQIEGGDLSAEDDADGGKDDEPEIMETEADFAAELEKVAKQAETTAVDTADSDAGEEESEDDLDEDQQKAFESIMAQIEGGDLSAEDDADGGKDDEPEIMETEADFAAELEKVAKQAEATAADTADSDAGEEESEDDLDEDQQKAFESIMAQIEGGDLSAEDDADGGKDDEPEIMETEADFAAELEKMAKQAEATAVDTADSDAGEEESEDDLDDDQQEVSETVTPGITDDPSEKDASLVDDASSTAVDKQKTATPTTDSTATKASADVGSDNDSDDVDKIFDAIASDLDESAEKQTTQTDEADALEVVRKDDGADNDQTEDPPTGDRLPEAEQASPKPIAPKKPAPKKEKKVAKPTGKKNRPAASVPPKEASPLPAVKPSRRIGKKIIFSMVVSLLISISAAGYYYWTHLRTDDPVTPPSGEKQALPPESGPTGEAPVAVTVTVADHSMDQQRLKTVTEEIDQLRREIIAKQKEIEELRTYYQTGIDAEIENLVNTLWETKRGVVPLKTALANPIVGMGIKAIQRREVYIEKLAEPVNTLYVNSEALLYLSRKAALLTMMSQKTSDIDVDGFVEQSHEMIASQRRTLVQLNIDDVDAPEYDLRSIWQRIEARLRDKTNRPPPPPAAKKTENEAIWKAICSGDFSQKHKLTALSPQAAQCLANWSGKDLFLNELTALEPEVARQLAQWKGTWLGLNGIKELSPEAATYLAQWKGKGLSLNGLSRLSPRLVAILSEWQGDQIELVNVRHMAHWENPNTRLFLSEEMARKINGKGQ